MTKIILITNADDFGLDSCINEAVEKAFLSGNLTSASLMAGMPGTEEAARIARCNRGLGVGLHFNLTQGRALGSDASSSLTAIGKVFHRRGSVERRALLGRFNADDVERELRAQLDALRALEVELDHIDGHQHVHVMPGVFGVVARVAREQRLAVRIPHHRFVRVGKVARREWKKVLRRSLLTGAMRVAGATRPPADLVVNDHFRCLFDLLPRPRNFGIDEVDQLLASLEPGVTEWMLHPSSQPAAGEEGTPLGRLRAEEQALLTSWSLAERLICSNEIALANYGELRAAAVPSGMAPGTDAAATATRNTPADSEFPTDTRRAA